VGGERLQLAPGCRKLTSAEAQVELRRALAAALPGEAAPLRALLPRLPFDGTDTLPRLKAAGVHIEIDRATRTGPRGLLLQGWLLDPGQAVAELRVCTESTAATLEPGARLRIPRPDVREAAGAAFVLDHDEWGFCAFADIPREAAWLEVELRSGEVGQRALGPGRGGGPPEHPPAAGPAARAGFAPGPGDGGNDRPRGRGDERRAPGPPAPGG
jgi:hypothetical protein